MTDLSVSEQKKLMKAARAARKGTGGPSESKSDLSGLETRQPKRARTTSTKAISSKHESQTLTVPVQEDVSQSDPKKLKILASEDIQQAAWRLAHSCEDPEGVPSLRSLSSGQTTLMVLDSCVII